MWPMYQNLAKVNPTTPNAFTLSCRRAKELLYSSPRKWSVINFGLFPGIRFTEKDLDKVIDETPVAKVLKETINLNDHECNLMGNKFWKTLFKEFLTEKKAEMTKQVINISYIVLTGDASKMFFIRNVISEVFDDIPADLMKYDVDPSRIVSKGLTLAAVHRYTTPLVRDICLIEERIGSIIERGFPVLLEDFEKIILPVAGQAIRKRIDEWKTKSKSES